MHRLGETQESAKNIGEKVALIMMTNFRRFDTKTVWGIGFKHSMQRAKGNGTQIVSLFLLDKI